MKVKKLSPQERYDAYLISTFCFHTRIEEPEKEREKIIAGTEENWGAFSDDGTLMAGIVNNKYDFFIDGKKVKTGGIGLVSTLPEYRNSGAITQIFKTLLQNAYENAEVISTLYPFNHEFYAKVGYQTVAGMNTYEFKPSDLSLYKFDGEVKMWKPNEPVTDYLNLYNEFAPSFNFSAARDEKMMESHMKVAHLYKDRHFCYKFSKGGKDIGYIIFTDVFSPEAAILKVDEVCWISKEGFNAVLSFIARFSSDYGTVKLTLPYGIDLYRIVKSKDAYAIQKTSHHDFMVRTVNAAKLLETIDKPADCAFSVKVSDEIIPQNNCTFKVTNDSVQKTDSTADIELSEGTLSQLCTGAISFDEACLKEDVKVNSNEAMLKKVFAEKKIFVSEHF